MAAKQKYYVVWNGRKPGVYSTWDDCKAQVDGFPGAKYKSYPTREQANAAFKVEAAQALSSREPGSLWMFPADPESPGRIYEEKVAWPELDSLSVDAACQGNPGILEYRCVHTRTGKLIFQQGPFQNGTNNIGEFLAVVEALQYLVAHQLELPIYSDSKIAINWVKRGECRTQLAQTRVNKKLFELIRSAEKWLGENSVPVPVLKWDTKTWGEIPADYDRK